MPQPSSTSMKMSTTDNVDGKDADLSLSNEKRNKFKSAPQDPISSRLNTESNEDSFQQDIPQPLTGLWRFYSDQIARENVQKADQKQDTEKDTGDVSSNTTDKFSDGGDTNENTYGKISKTPLIEEEDTFDEEPPQPIAKNGGVHVLPRKKTGGEGSVQFNLPQPFTGLWQRFSDMVAYENVQKSNPKQPNDIPVKDGVVSSSNDSPPALDATFDESDESQRSRRNHVPPPPPPPNGSNRRSRGDSESESYESPALLFQGTFSNEEEEVGIEAIDKAFYIDPSLVQRAHAASRHHHHHHPSLSIPKMVKIPSEDSLQDAPHVVSIHGYPKRVQRGMVEVDPGKFVRVHGERHAKSAMEKGQSIVVKCASCQHKFQVDRKAGSLYCTHCKSVTRLRPEKKKSGTMASI